MSPIFFGFIFLPILLWIFIFFKFLPNREVRNKLKKYTLRSLVVTFMAFVITYGFLYPVASGTQSLGGLDWLIAIPVSLLTFLICGIASFYMLNKAVKGVSFNSDLLDD
jgi:hypothetical protein